MQEEVTQFMELHRPVEHHHHYDVKTELPGILPIKMFEAHFGITKAAIESKIRAEKWVEGEQYVKDPDGRIHVIVEGYYQWVLKNQKPSEQVSEQKTALSSSTSAGKVSDIGQRRTSARRNKGSKPQPRFDSRL